MNSVPTTAGLRLLLREATRSLHEETDELVMASLAHESTWAHLLLGLHKSLGMHRHQLDRASELFGVTARSVDLLDRLATDSDLQQLPSRAIDLTHVPTEGALADAHAVGVGYVFEGSALGASTVSDHARKNGRTASYFDALSKDCRSRWPIVAKHLSRATFDTPQQQTAVDAANGVFSALISTIRP